MSRLTKQQWEYLYHCRFLYKAPGRAIHVGNKVPATEYSFLVNVKERLLDEMLRENVQPYELDRADAILHRAIASWMKSDTVMLQFVSQLREDLFNGQLITDLRTQGLEAKVYAATLNVVPRMAVDYIPVNITALARYGAFLIQQYALNGNHVEYRKLFPKHYFFSMSSAAPPRVQYERMALALKEVILRQPTEHERVIYKAKCPHLYWMKCLLLNLLLIQENTKGYMAYDQKEVDDAAKKALPSITADETNGNATAAPEYVIGWFRIMNLLATVPKTPAEMEWTLRMCGQAMAQPWKLKDPNIQYILPHTKAKSRAIIKLPVDAEKVRVFPIGLLSPNNLNIEL